VSNPRCLEHLASSLRAIAGGTSASRQLVQYSEAILCQLPQLVVCAGCRDCSRHSQANPTSHGSACSCRTLFALLGVLCPIFQATPGQGSLLDRPAVGRLGLCLWAKSRKVLASCLGNRCAPHGANVSALEEEGLSWGVNIVWPMKQVAGGNVGNISVFTGRNLHGYHPGTRVELSCMGENDVLWIAAGEIWLVERRHCIY
jgi:hypothetical protein